MTFQKAIKIGLKKFPDNSWRMKRTEIHTKKGGEKSKYTYWCKWFIRKCFQCGEIFPSPEQHRKLRCSRNCIPKKIGIYIHKNSGYIYIRENGKSRAEHRIIMEKHIGRTLDRTEYVHHKNHKRSDNRIENLQIVSLSEHNKIHKPEEAKGWERNKNGQFIH